MQFSAHSEKRKREAKLIREKKFLFPSYLSFFITSLIKSDGVPFLCNKDLLQHLIWRYISSVMLSRENCIISRAI